MLQRIVPTVARTLGVCAFISITMYSVHLSNVPDYTIECTAYLACPPNEPCVCHPADYTEMCCGYKINEVVLMAYIILFALLAYSTHLAVERWITFHAADRQSKTFKSQVAEALLDNRAGDVANIASLFPKSPLAAVVAAWQRGHATDGVGRGGIAPSMEARQQAIVIKTAELNKGLWRLSAAGWTMALIGLLLLIFGTIQGLHAVRFAEGMFAPYIARSLADAMWAVVVAILAAIPIIWVQKCLSARAATFVLEMEKLSLSIVGLATGPRPHASLPAAGSSYITRPLDIQVTRRLGD